MAVSVTNADAYFQNEVLHNQLWLEASLETKQRALKNAENMLYRFYRMFDPVDKPVPEQAVFEQSYFLLLVDETIQKSALGVKQVSVSGLSISVNAPTYPIAPEVKMIMAKHGAGGVRVGRSLL
ncbi:hypothetical protein ABES03_08630 [Neobacillus rhizosphaerae]|uniref:hypothetical protein n=1 Tax=Neobacillus rhizosphaerae TaxID=2880965 RepID=UPI003D2B0933